LGVWIRIGFAERPTVLRRVQRSPAPTFALRATAGKEAGPYDCRSGWSRTLRL